MSTSNLNDLYDNLYMLLLSLNKEFFNHNVIMKKFTLPHSHIKVLFYLIYHGPTSISKMANELCVSKPNMTPIIDKLVEDGFVTKMCIRDRSKNRYIVLHLKLLEYHWYHQALTYYIWT